MSPAQDSPPTRGDIVRGSLILLFASGALLWLGYARAVGGGSGSDARLAVAAAFAATLGLVTFGLRALSGVQWSQTTGRLTSGYVLVALAVGVGMLALVARASSPVWHGAFIAGWAGAMAGLGAVGLLKPDQR